MKLLNVGLERILVKDNQMASKKMCEVIDGI